MRPINKFFRYSCFILLAYGNTTLALSIEKNTAKQHTAESSSGLQSHVWYDGQKRRIVWLNPYLVADFQGKSAQTNLLKKRYPGTRVKLNHRSVRIWQLPTQPLSDNTPANLVKSSKSIPSGYSPIFHDTPY